MTNTADLRIRRSQALITPAVLAEELPLDNGGSEFIADARLGIGRCLAGTDPRLVVIVGPCSIHDPVAALDYASHLQERGRDYAAQLCIVLRVYFEKPRTVMGWKGLINDPDLDNSFHINRGLHIARRLLLDINTLGLPAASEFLDTTIGQYYAELVSFGAIGARTVESQIHRELASGLSMPVGIKNRTDGDIGVAIDAIRAARHPHWFPSLTREGTPAILESMGNDQGYLILRGGNRTGPNYEAAAVSTALQQLDDAGLPRSLIVDCSHGNSRKDPSRQAAVVESLAVQIQDGQHGIRGVMLESHLKGGAQKLGDPSTLEYGMSVTDACLSLDDTLPLLDRLAATVG